MRTFFTLFFNRIVDGHSSKDFRTYVGAITFLERNELCAESVRLYVTQYDDNGNLIPELCKWLAL